MNPTPELWRTAEEIFLAALDEPPETRGRLVEERCAGDDLLRSEVHSLLEALEQADHWIPPEPTAPPSESACGRRVGPYQIERLIGRGGMGAVYLAHRADGQFEQKVAVKLVGLPFDLELFQERFRRERQILAGLNHPNITRLLDGGITPDGELYLVMEYVDGLPLDQYCRRGDASLPERLGLFRAICDAVQHAHRNLIVHRDLKPSNILVTNEAVPKLLDFGTAKLLTEESGPREFTGTGMALMTPAYASPEQLRGEPVTTLSDVYALGLLLFELLTGQKAHAGAALPDPNRELVKPSASAAHSGDARLSRQLRGDLDRIVAKAVQADPAQRYSSAEQLSEDIRRYLNREPVLAHAPGVLYHAAKFLRRHWVAAAAAAFCILALAASTAYSMYQARQARLEADKAKAVTRFLQTTLASASTIAGGRKDITVIEAMDQAQSNSSKLAGQPSVEATIRYSIGTVYLGLNALPKAETELKRALDLARRFGSAEEAVQVQLALAEIPKDGRPDVDAFRQVVGYVRKAGPRVDPYLARRSFVDLANSAWALHGHNPEVEPLLREAIGISRANPGMQTFELAYDLSYLAGYLIEEGRGGEAQDFLEEALAIQRAQPHRTVAIAQTLLSLGQIRSRQGDLVGAERYFRELRDEMRRQLDPLGSVDSVSRWGRVWALLGHADEAVREIGGAIEAARQQYPTDGLVYWAPYVSYAFVLNLANRPKEAEPYARQSLSLLKEAPPKDARRAESLCETGVSLVLQRRFKEAIPILQESESIYVSLPGWGSKNRQTLRVQEFLAKARRARRD